MKFPRRQFLCLCAGVNAAPVISRMAWAQAYPTRPVRIIVGFSAGVYYARNGNPQPGPKFNYKLA